MTNTDQLLAENAELRSRLEEAEETLRAIREGEVDAVIVSGSKGDRLFALSETENLHRLMVETMNEAGLVTAPDGLLVFCNGRACALLGRSNDHLLGHDLGEFVTPADRVRFRQLLQTGRGETADARIEFLAATGATVPMHVWASQLDRTDNPLICLVATDLSRLEADRSMIDKLQEQKQQLRDSRKAALNLMKDAVVAREQAEQAREEIRRHVEELKAANETLTAFNAAMVDRELRMIELKKRMNELCVKAGLPPEYDVEFGNQ